MGKKRKVVQPAVSTNPDNADDCKSDSHVSELRSQFDQCMFSLSEELNDLQRALICKDPDKDLRLSFCASTFKNLEEIHERLLAEVGSAESFADVRACLANELAGVRDRLDVLAARVVTLSTPVLGNNTRVPDDDDRRSFSSTTSVASVRARLRVAEVQVRAKALEEEVEREKRLRDEMAAMDERRRQQIEQELEMQRKLSESRREVLMAQEFVKVAESLGDDPILESPDVVAMFSRDDSQFKPLSDVNTRPNVKLDKKAAVSAPALALEAVNKTGCSCACSAPVSASVPDCGKPLMGAQGRTPDIAMSDLVTALRQIPNLPSAKMMKFNGDPAHFIEFRTSFKLQIEPFVHNDVERFMRLLYLCEGPAKDAIQGCINLSPDQMYRTAWEDLTENFGQAYSVAESQMRKIRDYQVKKHDAQSLLAFARRLEEVRRAMLSMGQSYSTRLDNDELLRQLMRKLPSESLQRRWVEKAGSLLEVRSSVTMKDFIDFVKLHGMRLNNVFGNELKTASNKSHHGSAFAITFSGSSSERNLSPQARDCSFCGKLHPIWRCQSFQAKSVTDRLAHVKKAKLCMRCLRKGHFARDCQFKLKCQECKSIRHSTLLHGAQQQSEGEHSVEVTEVKVGSTSTALSAVWLKVLPVRVNANGRSIVTYAFLDSGSDTSLCSQSLINSLRLRGRPVRYQLSTVSGVKSQRSSRVNLSVSSMDSQVTFDLSCLSIGKIPINEDNVARPNDLARYAHLKDIELPTCEGASVSILIGADYSAILESQLECRSGGLNEPVAVKTCLGWTISGPVGQAKTSPVSVNRIQCQEDILRSQFERLYDSEFGDLLSSDRKVLSPDEKRASELMNESVRFRDGHYHVDLPFKKDPEVLKGNFSLAAARLQYLKRKLEKEPNLKDQYCRVLKKYENEGALRYVGNVPTGGRWYIPHHAVVNPSKPDPRVVFDCAAKFQGKSLNDFLYTGPKNTSPLVEVLFRFRVDQVAVISDIKSMFHQVCVGDCDSEKVSFLWWPTDNFSSDPETFEMRVHLFGASSSPSVCEFALRKTADDHAQEFSPVVLDSVRRDFYVDDLLKSYRSEHEAIAVSKEITDLVSRGGFKLTKWISNSRRVIESFPEEERAPSILKVDLDRERSPSAKALGVIWDTDSDFLLAEVSGRSFEKTRRGVLASVASVFDPLGMIAPLALRGKLINQELFRLQLGWDDVLPPSFLASWNEWLLDLSRARSFGIPRCLKPDFCDFLRVELHHFSDASEVGYGTASYLRFISGDGQVHCSFLFGKSRVKPSKPGITIPKLELTAAVLLVSVNDLVIRSLDGRLRINTITFWTDSMIVLKYIHNETKGLTVFVANRVAKIREVSSPSQWFHVRSEENPADVASRGLRSTDEDKWKLWASGPQFLWESDRCREFVDFELQDSDEGVKMKKTVMATTQISPVWSFLFQRYSAWTKLQRVIAWVLRAVNYFKGEKPSSPNLSFDELCESERVTLEAVQKDAFGDIQDCERLSRLSKLKPFFYRGLVRVGGRLKHANLSEEARHPVILPSKHRITELIILHYHVVNGHVGANHTLSLLRERYWIVHGVSATRRVLRGCLHCKRHNQTPGIQLMASLPKERVSCDESSFPFEVTGVDLFGPLFVLKNVRTRSRGLNTSIKRYGVIFTCFRCRAVHLEMAADLSTDSFINCLLRFIARRGAPRLLYSDNGTNFRGAAPEVLDGLKRLDQERIGRSLSERRVSWRFNPPGASHRGGCGSV